jgi:hypothetical protein
MELLTTSNRLNLIGQIESHMELLSTSNRLKLIGQLQLSVEPSDYK